MSVIRRTDVFLANLVCCNYVLYGKWAGDIRADYNASCLT